MLKLLAVAVAVAFVAGGVSGETHHVAGGDSGWGPDFNVTAWLLGRRFTVGDKIRFECSREDEGIVEVRDAEEFATCNVTNPIRMLTDPVSHVALEEEGVRYFTSGNPDSCRNGLKLPVSVHHQYEYEYEYDHSPPHQPPYEPDVPSPPHQPPYEPDVPSPPHEPYKAPPPPHSYPSAATRVDAVCFVLAAAVNMIIIYGLTI